MSVGNLRRSKPTEDTQRLYTNAMPFYIIPTDWIQWLHTPYTNPVHDWNLFISECRAVNLHCRALQVGQE